MLADDLRPLFIFDGLTDAQLADLAAVSERVAFAEHEELFKEGDPASHWWVLLDGQVRIVRRAGREEPVFMMSMERPGQWAGGFQAWADASYLATGKGEIAGHMLRVPASELGRLASEWTPFGVHMIKGFFQTVRTMDTLSREREQLIKLGEMSARLAHEINNPASAAARSVDALSATCDSMLSALVQLSELSLSSERFVAIDALRREVDSTAPRDPGAIADTEEEISEWLSDHGVSSGWRIAPPLAAAGVDVGWCERAAAILDGETLEPGLAWVATTLASRTLLAEMKSSTGRVSELIDAAKSYSQMDRPSMQTTDVTEGLESTLVILRSKVAGGIAVVRDYAADAPRVFASPGALNQVWTNLIANAIDAMNGDGTLRLTTRAEDTRLVVEVTDTGPGMPPYVQNRAFEPWFTTKDVGKGTGLGLDISRKIIVDMHHGDISIHSTPRGTTMRVSLPRPPG
jgi:signal transduction histidine kinase